MKGILTIALFAFKWSAGLILGFLGFICFLYLTLIVLGLLAAVLKEQRFKRIERSMKRARQNFVMPPEFTPRNKDVS